MASRRDLQEDEAKALTLAGMAGAFGGLFSSPILASFLVLEVAQTALRRFERAFFGSLVASSISFGIWFAIAGSIFIGIYEMPGYEYVDWHLSAFAVSTASGFIGGPTFPILFMGGTAGAVVHELLPGLPIGLTFSCMLATVPGAIVAAPFSMVLLAALFTQVGALETAPILVAVGTASLTVAAIRAARARRSVASSEPSAR